MKHFLFFAFTICLFANGFAIENDDYTGNVLDKILEEDKTARSKFGDWCTDDIYYEFDTSNYTLELYFDGMEGYLDPNCFYNNLKILLVFSLH